MASKDEVQTVLKRYGLEKLPADTYRVVFKKAGECIVKAGDPLSWVGVIQQGKAKICTSSADGKNLLLAYYMEEGLIGELELLTDRSVITTNVIAQSDVTYIRFELDTIVQVFQSNLRFAQSLARMMAAKLYDSTSNYTSSALCTGEQRLCAYILQGAADGVFREVLTDVACSIGVSYRHLLRLLERLCGEGILEKKPDGYWIAQRQRLVEKAM